MVFWGVGAVAAGALLPVLGVVRHPGAAIIVMPQGGDGDSCCNSTVRALLLPAICCAGSLRVYIAGVNKIAVIVGASDSHSGSKFCRFVADLVVRCENNIFRYVPAGCCKDLVVILHYGSSHRSVNRSVAAVCLSIKSRIGKVHILLIQFFLGQAKPFTEPLEVHDLPGP